MVGMCFGKFILYIIYEVEEVDNGIQLGLIVVLLVMIVIGDVVVDVMWNGVNGLLGIY